MSATIAGRRTAYCGSKRCVSESCDQANEKGRSCSGKRTGVGSCENMIRAMRLREGGSGATLSRAINVGWRGDMLSESGSLLPFMMVAERCLVK